MHIAGENVSNCLKKWAFPLSWPANGISSHFTKRDEFVANSDTRHHFQSRWALSATAEPNQAIACQIPFVGTILGSAELR